MFSNNKTNLTVKFKTQCDKSSIQLFSMKGSNISLYNVSSEIKFAAANAACGDEMSLKSDEFGGFIAIMGAAPRGNITY